MAPNLATLKKHVRADDFHDDDRYLSGLLKAARAWVVDATHREEGELVEMGGGREIPAPLQQAVLLLAGHWYNQREAVASGGLKEAPYTIQALVKPFRLLVDDGYVAGVRVEASGPLRLEVKGCGTGLRISAAAAVHVITPEDVDAFFDGLLRKKTKTKAMTDDIYASRTPLTDIQAEGDGDLVELEAERRGSRVVIRGALNLTEMPAAKVDEIFDRTLKRITL